MTRTRTRVRLLAGGCAVAVLAIIASCATSTGDTTGWPEAGAAAQGGRACWPLDQFGNEMPSLNPPYATELTSEPIELTAGAHLYRGRRRPAVAEAAAAGDPV